MGIQDTNSNEVNYTADEFVKQADITESTLYQWIRQGLISPGTKRAGEERRWKQADLMDASFIKDMRNKTPQLVYDGQLASRTVWKWFFLGDGNISTLQRAMVTWGEYQQKCPVAEAHHENVRLAKDLQGSSGFGAPYLAAIFTVLPIPGEDYKTYCETKKLEPEEGKFSDVPLSERLYWALRNAVFGNSQLPAIAAKHPNALFSKFSLAKRREDQEAFLRGLSTQLPKQMDLLKRIPSISNQNWEYARYCCLLRMAADQQQGKRDFSLVSLHNTACEMLFFWLAKTLDRERLRAQPIEWEWIDAQKTLRLTIPVQWQEKSGVVYLDLPLSEK